MGRTVAPEASLNKLLFVRPVNFEIHLNGSLVRCHNGARGCTGAKIFKIRQILNRLVNLENLETPYAIIRVVGPGFRLGAD